MKKMEKAKLFRISRENAEWFSQNYENLKRKYDNRWIIIHNKKIAESASTFNDIMELMRDHKYDPNSILVEYMQRKTIAMFF